MLLSQIILMLVVAVPRRHLADADTPSPAPNASSVTPAPTEELTDDKSADPIAVGVGVFLLLLLFGTAFYFVVVWPKRSMAAYRERFYNLVGYDSGHSRTHLSAPFVEQNDASPSRATSGSPARAGFKVPTFKERSAPRAEAEAQSSPPTAKLFVSL